MRKTLLTCAFIIILTVLSSSLAFAEEEENTLNEEYCSLGDYYTTIENNEEVEWRVNPNIAHTYLFRAVNYSMFDRDISEVVSGEKAYCILFCSRVQRRSESAGGEWHDTNTYAYHLVTRFTLNANYLEYTNVREFDTMYKLNILPVFMTSDIRNSLVTEFTPSKDNFLYYDGLFSASPFIPLFDEPDTLARFYDCQIHFANKVDYNDISYGDWRHDRTILCQIDTYFMTTFIDSNLSDNEISQDFAHSVCYALTGYNPYSRNASRENNIDWLFKFITSEHYDSSVVYNLLGTVFSNCSLRLYPVIIRPTRDGDIHIVPDNSVSTQILTFLVNGASSIRTFTTVYHSLYNQRIEVGNMSLQPFKILLTLFYYGTALLVPLGLYKGVFYG